MLVAASASERDADERRFGFVLSGCRATSAILTITSERMSPQPVDGENIRCVRAEHFVAIFDVDAEMVPPEAEIG
ncbi:MAG: hypothetical protein GEV11_22775 [Streptosporangiales bacterium]|nr:hypothetical protein [Streptosporangiales bacterium]